MRSTEDDVAELAPATGGDGLKALLGPRLSLGDPSPPAMGGVLEVGGEFAVVTVNSPVQNINTQYSLLYGKVLQIPTTFNTVYIYSERHRFTVAI
jgi:hypothetical protein